jgi:hypothetical protein
MMPAYHSSESDVELLPCVRRVAVEKQVTDVKVLNMGVGLEGLEPSTKVDYEYFGTDTRANPREEVRV